MSSIVQWIGGLTPGQVIASWFVVGWASAMVGFFIAALCVAAGRADERAEVMAQATGGGQDGHGISRVQGLH